ncbi:sensor histidine kinase [Streptomyces smaragdinus]|uniref:sensor histidine kinase n=1 Tax=Streptomyces smaragdinus TaxID=2585196 RepID=UPI0012980011|nr:sensor histidine kinase [Streptomyces smaragdinus]
MTPPAQWTPDGPPTATQRLHAATQRVRAFDARRPLLWDTVLTALIALPGVLQVADGSPPQTGHSAGGALLVPLPVVWLVLAGLVVPLLWRRQYPFTVYLVISAALVAHDLAGLASASLIAIGVALYHVALRLPLARLGAAFGIIALGMGIQIGVNDTDDFWREYTPVVAVAGCIAMTGVTARTRREYVASLVECAERLEVERDQRERLAAAAERARIAREMHDIIAHNLSVIVGLADGGAYAAARAPERPAQALRAISATGREALGELRRLLGVLREPAPALELAPQPGLAELEPLLDRVRAAGLPVVFTVRGSPGGLSRGRQLTVYRVVQEALTNTLKHAGPGARAEVSLAVTDGLVLVGVADRGGGRSSAGAVGGDGQGIHGMRERVALYGGTLSAGVSPEGGWRVRAQWPAAGADGLAEVRV